MSKSREARHYILGHKNRQRFISRFKQAGFFIATVISGIVLTALVTSVTEQTSTQFARSADAQANTPMAASVAKSSDTESRTRAEKLAPSPAVKPAPKPRSAKTTVRTTSETPTKPKPVKKTLRQTKRSTPICSKADRTSAKRHYKQQRADEIKRHKRAMWSIQRTGWITRILNPGTYRYRAANENNAHDKNLARINNHYRQALTAAHCS